MNYNDCKNGMKEVWGEIWCIEKTKPCKEVLTKNCLYKQNKELQEQVKKLKYYLNKIRDEELNSLDITYDEYITQCTNTEYSNIINLIEIALEERKED